MVLKDEIIETMYCEDLRRQVYSLRKKLDFLLDRLFTIETKLSSINDCVCNAEIMRHRHVDRYMN